MIGKLREAANAARLRAGQMLREHSERKAEDKAKRADPPNVTVSAELVRGVKFAAWIAYFALMYFLWERVLDVSQAQHSTLEVTHFGIWSNLDLAIFFPLIVGYIFVVVGVPYVAKISIPTLVSLNWTEHFWPKLTSLVITLLVSVVLITGTATVGSNAIIESERGAAVAVEQVQQNRAGMEAQIESRRQELADMMNNSNAYLAQAASVGAAEWQRSYIDQTPANDPQRDRIVRALGAARAADTLRAELATLRQQLAAAPTTAAVSSEVVTDRTQTLNGVMDFLNTFWVLMLAVVMDLSCLFLPWIAMRLEQKRNAQLGMAGGIPQHPWMIEDHSGEDAFIDTSPREAAKAVFAQGGSREAAEEAAYEAARVQTRRSTLKDADTDQVIIDKDGHLAKIVREHTRKIKGKDGKPVQMVMPAAPPQPDETGVEHDGGGRVGSVSGGREGNEDDRSEDEAESVEDVAQPQQPSTEKQEPDGDAGVGPLSDEALQNDSPSEALSEPELTEAERAEFAMLAEQAGPDGEQILDEVVSAEQRQEQAPSDGDDIERELQTDIPAEREPETDERRLIAAG